jgi:Uncharacterized conserved protein (COG2071)/Phage integrase family
VGVTPFLLEDLRTPVGPALPWFTSFPETNVRTYVVGPDGREGLWFFSLDAARLEPVLVARSTYALPYMWSAMTVERDGPVVRYRSRRRWPGPTPAASSVTLEVGDRLVAALAEQGRTIRPATIQVALDELMAAELVADVGEVGQQRWLAVRTARDPLLEAVDLHGAHDFRHTFATWLEDAGIPARVIDEVMGHEASGRTGQQRGSAMGAHYRHTTPEMAARIAAAIEQRLTVVLRGAEQALEALPSRSSQRVF